MSAVLITGISGFTGRYLAGALRQEGHEVLGVGQNGGYTSSSDVFSCDLLDRRHLREVVKQTQPDYVVHLAAISYVAHGDVDAIYRTNVVGTRNLLEALSLNSKLPHAILLASSANLYGNSLEDPISELAPVCPTNDYAVSKLCMEYMARLWVDKLPITIVRPFNYTGVGQSLNFLLPKIVDHFQRGANEIELGNIDVARDFSDVRTVVAAYCKLLKSVRNGGIFNICSGRAHSIRDILTMMSEISGISVKVRVNPNLIRANEVKTLRGNNSKLVAIIGGLDTIPLEKTLQWMWASK